MESNLLSGFTYTKAENEFHAFLFYQHDFFGFNMMATLHARIAVCLIGGILREHGNRVSRQFNMLLRGESHIDGSSLN